MTVSFVVHEGVATMGDSLEGAVGKMWDLERLGIKASDEVHKLFESDISFIDGRHSVKLSWKQSHNPLPSNYANSLSCMKSQIKRLKGELEVLEEYDSIIKDQLSSGVIERVRVGGGVQGPLFARSSCHLQRCRDDKIKDSV